MKGAGDLDWYLFQGHEVPIQSLLLSWTMLLLLLANSSIFTGHCCLHRWRSPDVHVADPDRPKADLQPSVSILPASLQAHVS